MRDPDPNSGWLVYAARDAGLERLTSHDLRHTAVSLAISSGANIKVVQRIAGHKSAMMTLDRYADLFPVDLGDLAERLDDLRDAIAAIQYSRYNLSMDLFYLDDSNSTEQSKDNAYGNHLRRELTSHDLRHTAVSLAISSGANIKVVQRIAGHKSATMTLDRYADLFPVDLGDLADRLDDMAFGGTSSNDTVTTFGK